MPDDLPAIDSSLDAPLPQVAPNSDLVPYRMARTDPGGQPVVTTGYGPRARPPIQPPDNFDLRRVMDAAFSNLPVDQAVKAIEAATRFQGQRGYMRDLQNGMNAAQAFAKWGPMLFHQATGIPEAIDRSVPTPITPQQMIQNRLNQQKFEAAQTAAKAKADAGMVRSVGGGLYRVKPEGQPETLIAPKEKEVASPETKAELTDAYKQLDEARKDMAKLVATPVPKKQEKQHQQAMDDATMRMGDARKTIAKLAAGNKPTSPTAPKVLTKELAAEFKKQAGGDLEKARKLARDAGYSF